MHGYHTHGHVQLPTWLASLLNDMFMQLCFRGLGKLKKPSGVHSAEANGVMIVEA